MSPGSSSSTSSVAGQAIEASIGAADFAMFDDHLDNLKRGDTSRLWRWPGFGVLDHLSASLPAKVAPYSPLAARVMSDGTGLRAMIGTLSLLVPVAGLVMGMLAASYDGGYLRAPATSIVMVIVVLAAIDAAAGAAAALAFSVGVLSRGHIDSLADIRLAVGINLLMVAIPLGGSMTRPLRRQPSTTWSEHFDRAADVVIAGLLAAWTAKMLVEALPGLGGEEYPVSDHGNQIALAALVTMGVRMLWETVAMWWFPTRLETVTAHDVPEPGTLRMLTTIFTQSLLLLFAGLAFVGHRWELYLGVGLFAIPQVIALFADRYPNQSWLTRVMPSETVRITILVVSGAALAIVLEARISDPVEFLRAGFILYSVPAMLLTIASLFAREGDRPELNWFGRLAGAGVLWIGVCSVMGLAMFA